jgi:hypothetical protein
MPPHLGYALLWCSVSSPYPLHVVSATSHILLVVVVRWYVYICIYPRARVDHRQGLVGGACGSMWDLLWIPPVVGWCSVSSPIHTPPYPYILSVVPVGCPPPDVLVVLWWYIYLIYLARARRPQTGTSLWTPQDPPDPISCHPDPTSVLVVLLLLHAAYPHILFVPHMSTYGEHLLPTTTPYQKWSHSGYPVC